jgi:hypothetical protein
VLSQYGSFAFSSIARLAHLEARWVNRKDRFGRNLFEGGFLGLGNIGVFGSAPATRRDVAPRLVPPPGALTALLRKRAPHAERID